MSGNDELTCRLMLAGEEQAVHDLVSGVFSQFVAPLYSQEGTDYFNTFLTLDFLAETSQEKFTLVAAGGKNLAGMISIRNHSHISLLFVDARFQGRGIGRRLVDECRTECLARAPGLELLTVHSSPNSLSFYEHLGFVRTGPEKNEQGMRFTPMQLSLESLM